MAPPRPGTLAYREYLKRQSARKRHQTTLKQLKNLKPIIQKLLAKAVAKERAKAQEVSNAKEEEIRKKNRFMRQAYRYEQQRDIQRKATECIIMGLLWLRRHGVVQQSCYSTVVSMARASVGLILGPMALAPRRPTRKRTHISMRGCVCRVCKSSLFVASLLGRLGGASRIPSPGSLHVVSHGLGTGTPFYQGTFKLIHSPGPHSIKAFLMGF